MLTAKLSAADRPASTIATTTTTTTTTANNNSDNDNSDKTH